MILSLIDGEASFAIYAHWVRMRKLRRSEERCAEGTKSNTRSRFATRTPPSKIRHRQRCKRLVPAALFTAMGTEAAKGSCAI